MLTHCSPIYILAGFYERSCVYDVVFVILHIGQMPDVVYPMDNVDPEKSLLCVSVITLPDTSVCF